MTAGGSGAGQAAEEAFAAVWLEEAWNIDAGNLV